MAERRKDSRGRNLKDGETQLTDGRYKFQFTDTHGVRKAVYSWKLTSTDRLPPGKRPCKALRQIEEEIANNARDGIDGLKGSKITVNEMFSIYMQGKTNLKQSSKTNYLYMYDKFVKNDLGRKSVSSIKFSTIRNFYLSLIEKGLKPKSLEIIHLLLHPTFELAARDGLIRSNPTSGIMGELKKNHNWEKPKRHALTVEQRAVFMGFLVQSHIYNHWLPLFTVLLGTGLRIGECIGLRWMDINLEGGFISVNHSLLYKRQDDGHCKMYISTPKTSAGKRTVPMLSAVRDAFITERNKQLSQGVYFEPKVEVDGFSGFIFLNKHGTVHNPTSVNAAIKRIIKAANEWESKKAKAEKRKEILLPDFSCHNLRHTFCTRLCENESNIKLIQDVMGHSSVAVTLDIYTEVTEGKKKEIFENLDEKIKIV